MIYYCQQANKLNKQKEKASVAEAFSFCPAGMGVSPTIIVCIKFGENRFRLVRQTFVFYAGKRAICVP